ncbi:flavoprotein [Gordonia sp. PDNC005]|uniref:flavoprotein n=1 Tax=Gordonia sp. PDNC005 TaxID=2811424 RepID=UPI0019649179|nr:flavoprotein [Gordonia sp. PDNC005]QRY62426.1 flavoprotein [Gordonia sp. PDNC005]
MKLLLVVTGSATAAHVPYWINWIAMHRPGHRVRVLVTEGARRFVTPASLASAVVDEVLVDAWDAVDDRPVHVEYAAWADGVIVYPASQNYLADLASDRVDRPSLLTIALSTAPVVVAPGLPPGGLASPGLVRSWTTLEERGSATVLSPVPGVSKHDPTLTSWAPGDFTAAVALVEPDPERVGRTVLQTDLLRTEIDDADSGGWTWTRTPGTAAPAPFTAHSSPEFAAVRRWMPDGLLLGSAVEDSRVYTAPAPRSVAGALIDDGPSAVAPAVLEAVGASLRELHSTPTPENIIRGSTRGVDRLVNWLDGRGLAPTARVARERLNVLPGDVAAGLRTVVSALLDAPSVLCHGAPTLGSVVLAGERPLLLTGEDVAVAPADTDLLWVVGELVEYGLTFDGADSGWTAHVDAFLAGYGGSGRTSVADLAAVRIALHLHDYIVYVGWSTTEFDRYHRMIRYLLENGDSR